VSTGAASDPRRAEQEHSRSRWSRVIASTGMRRGLVVVLILLVVEYFVVPALVGATKNLDVFSRINLGWLVTGTALQAGSLLCYALLTRTLLFGTKLGVFTLARITLATTATSHLIPAGAVGSAGLGYQLLTAKGVAAADAGFALATGAIGSAVVLNAMLLPALVVSIPLAGLHPIYVVIALVGLLALLGAYALLYLLTRGEEYAVRIVRVVGKRVPRVGADHLERIVRQIGESLAQLAADRTVLRRAVLWAALNWLLDAASLWSFIAALGHRVNPVELFVAYGIAYVLAVIPLTPAGLGVIEVTAATLLLSFGVPRTFATLGVLGWRLVNFWLPIPLGVVAYLSLELPRGSDRHGRRHALSRMTTGARRDRPGRHCRTDA
jgi:uncharacterized protein (TIRG00374 family)